MLLVFPCYKHLLWCPEMILFYAKILFNSFISPRRSTTMNLCLYYWKQAQSSETEECNKFVKEEIEMYKFKCYPWIFKFAVLQQQQKSKSTLLLFLEKMPNCISSLGFLNWTISFSGWMKPIELIENEREQGKREHFI